MLISSGLTRQLAPATQFITSTCNISTHFSAWIFNLFHHFYCRWYVTLHLHLKLILNPSHTIEKIVSVLDVLVLHVMSNGNEFHWSSRDGLNTHIPLTRILLSHHISRASHWLDSLSLSGRNRDHFIERVFASLITVQLQTVVHVQWLSCAKH